MSADFLARLHVVQPCSESWERMTGTDRVRACEQCARNVYDLSHLTEAAALTLVREAEGRMCVRLLRRPDGKVVTSACITALATARRSGLVAFATRLALSGTLLAAACGVGAGETPDEVAGEEVVFGDGELEEGEPAWEAEPIEAEPIEAEPIEAEPMFGETIELEPELEEPEVDLEPARKDYVMGIVVMVREPGGGLSEGADHPLPVAEDAPVADVEEAPSEVAP